MTPSVSSGTAERNGLSDVISFFAGVPGKILSAIGDLGSLLLSAGEDVMHGLVQGIENGIGWVGDALKGVVSKIKSFVTNPLGIWSPSKVFAGYGGNLMEGLALGINNKSNLPAEAVGRVATSLSNGSLIEGLGSLAGGSGGGTTSAAPASGQTVIVRVEAGAVVISGLDPSAAGEARSAVNDGFTTLARELTAGVAPTKIGAGA